MVIERENDRAYIDSLEATGVKYSRDEWKDIIRKEAYDIHFILPDFVLAKYLDTLEVDGYVI